MNIRPREFKCKPYRLKESLAILMPLQRFAMLHLKQNTSLSINFGSLKRKSWKNFVRWMKFDALSKKRYSQKRYETKELFGQKRLDSRNGKKFSRELGPFYRKLEQRCLLIPKYGQHQFVLRYSVTMKKSLNTCWPRHYKNVQTQEIFGHKRSRWNLRPQG